MEFGLSQKIRSATSVNPRELKRNVKVMGYSNRTSKNKIEAFKQRFGIAASSPIRFQAPKLRSYLLSARKISTIPSTPNTNSTNVCDGGKRDIGSNKWLLILKLRIILCKFYKNDKEFNNDDSVVRETITNTLVQICQLFPDVKELFNDENKWCSCRQYSINCPHCRNALENVCDYLSEYETNNNLHTSLIENTYNKYSRALGLNSKSSDHNNRSILPKKFSNFIYFNQPTLLSSTYQSPSLDNASAKLQQNFQKCDLYHGKSSSGYSSIKSNDSSKRCLSLESSKDAALFKREFTKSCELFERKLEVHNVKNIEKHPLKFLYKTNACDFDKDESNMEINVSRDIHIPELEEQKVISTNPEETFDQKYKNCKLTFCNECLNFAGDNWVNLSKDISKSNICDSNEDYTKHFLMSVFSIYEKEQRFCSKLFNDELFEKALLMAAEAKYEREKKNKKGVFTRIIRNTSISMCLKKKVKDNKNCKETKKIINEELIEFQQNISSLASNTKKSFMMLAEAIKTSGTADDILKMRGLLRLLERIENRDVNMTYWKDTNICEDEICAELLVAFANVYDICRKKAKKIKKQITNNQLKLLKMFVIKYKMFELVSEIKFLASEISHGFIQTEQQLKNAVAFNLI